MGLPWSRDKVAGWNGQYQRLLRWHERLQGIRTARLEQVPEEHFDDVITFFQCCYSMRDWLIGAGYEKKSIDDAISTSLPMKACRDVCNRTKHYSIMKPSLDPHWSIGREYIPLDSGIERSGLTETWFLIAGEHKWDIFEVADSCVHFWKDFLFPENLDPNTEL